MTTKVFYHAHCMDGLAAAWVFRNAYPNDDVEFCAVSYSEDFEPVVDSVIYFLDFCLPADQMVALAVCNEEVIVLDHHVHSLKSFEGVSIPDNLHLQGSSTEHSGAVLTWLYFNANIRFLPKLLAYIEDRDLWRFKLPHSRDINAAIAVECDTFADLTQFDEWLKTPNSFDDIAETGSWLNKSRLSEASKIAEQAWEIAFLGFKVPVVNATTFVSEVGNEMCKGMPFSISFRDTPTQRVFSLRSQRVGGEDVGAICKSLGGGGHVNAAGFSTSLKEGIEICGRLVKE